MTEKKSPEISKTELEKEITRYTKNGDIFTAKNLLKNFGPTIQSFDCEKFLKLIEKNEKNKEA